MSYERYREYRLAPDDNGCWDILDNKTYTQQGTFPSKAAAKRYIDSLDLPTNNPTQPDSNPDTAEAKLPKLEDDLMYQIQDTITNHVVMSGDPLFDLAKDIEALFQQQLKGLLVDAAALNRKELAKDIKRRHWVNDKLRDAYLDAVIAVSDEQLQQTRQEEVRE